MAQIGKTEKLFYEEAVLVDGKTTAEKIAIGYGKLIEAGVDFLVIAFTVFMVVKLRASLKTLFIS